MGVSLLNFFDLKPLNTSKRALNTNHPFFWDTLYICIYIDKVKVVTPLQQSFSTDQHHETNTHPQYVSVSEH